MKHTHCYLVQNGALQPVGFRISQKAAAGIPPKNWSARTSSPKGCFPVLPFHAVLPLGASEHALQLASSLTETNKSVFQSSPRHFAPYSHQWPAPGPCPRSPPPVQHLPQWHGRPPGPVGASASPRRPRLSERRRPAAQDPPGDGCLFRFREPMRGPNGAQR